MSGSMCIEAFRPADDKWKAMKVAYDACEALKIQPPKEVLDFFGDMPPTDAGVCIELIEDVLIEYHG